MPHRSEGRISLKKSLFGKFTIPENQHPCVLKIRISPLKKGFFSSF
jgi:hypothetical protein